MIEYKITQTLRLELLDADVEAFKGIWEDLGMIWQRRGWSANSKALYAKITKELGIKLPDI